jgi:hypothetical protein
MSNILLEALRQQYELTKRVEITDIKPIIIERRDPPLNPVLFEPTRIVEKKSHQDKYTRRASKRSRW